jgi:hypothetical protein
VSPKRAQSLWPQNSVSRNGDEQQRCSPPDWRAEAMVSSRRLLSAPLTGRNGIARERTQSLERADRTKVKRAPFGLQREPQARRRPAPHSRFVRDDLSAAGGRRIDRIAITKTARRQPSKDFFSQAAPRFVPKVVQERLGDRTGMPRNSGVSRCAGRPTVEGGLSASSLWKTRSSRCGGGDAERHLRG